MTSGFEENRLSSSKAQKIDAKYKYQVEERTNEPFKQRHIQTRAYDEDSHDQRKSKYQAKVQDPARHKQMDSARDKLSRGSRKFLEDEANDGVSCYEALSCASQLQFNKSLAGSNAAESDKSHITYQSWADN